MGFRCFYSHTGYGSGKGEAYAREIFKLLSGVILLPLHYLFLRIPLSLSTSASYSSYLEYSQIYLVVTVACSPSKNQTERSGGHWKNHRLLARNNSVERRGLPDIQHLHCATSSPHVCQPVYVCVSSCSLPHCHLFSNTHAHIFAINLKFILITITAVLLT